MKYTTHSGLLRDVIQDGRAREYVSKNGVCSASEPLREYTSIQRDALHVTYLDERDRTGRYANAVRYWNLRTQMNRR